MAPRGYCSLHRPYPPGNKYWHKPCSKYHSVYITMVLPENDTGLLFLPPWQKKRLLRFHRYRKSYPRSVSHTTDLDSPVQIGLSVVIYEYRRINCIVIATD